MCKNNNVKGIYIRNIEAVDAYKFSKGEKLNSKGEQSKVLTINWSGYIPYSLELLKLKDIGLKLLTTRRIKNEDGKYEYINDIVELKDKDFTSGKNNKSLDLINVNFKCSYSKDYKEDDKYIELNEKRQTNKTNKKELEDKLKEKKVKLRENKKKLKENNENKTLAKEIETLAKEIETLIKNIEKIKVVLKKYKDNIDSIKDNYENGNMDREQLRDELYNNGFIDENGIKFVVYKRSGSKSRQGKIIFIRESLLEKMIDWSRMGINFPTDEDFDVVGLGAYSSLVSSNIEDTIIIDPKHILLVEDIKSVWKSKTAKLIVKDDAYEEEKDNHLKVIQDKENGIELESIPTDGSCLLDVNYFEDGIDFKLLRQHMFKSCAFRCNIQLYYQDYFKGDYEVAKVKNIFGEYMLAKDVKLICTPNSLKALKYSKYVSDGTEKGMFKYWKKKVKEDKNIFGVVKHNKSSKWQFDGKNYQQASYQIINSLPLDKIAITKLCEFEFKYVGKLKNDIEVFKNYLLLKSNNMNVNEAMVAILNKKPEFEKTELFRTFRTKTINKYKEKLKGGKIKNVGDYNTIISNPICYLKQSVGAYREDDLELKGNEVYTKLFDVDKELIMFRNPHTSQANVYIGKNTKVDLIDRYFNFGKNIVVVNSVKNEICQIMSSMDFDSDNCLIYDNETMTEAGRACYGVYGVCENGINKDNNKYKLTNSDMAKVDFELSKSQTTIGTVVNLGQLAMSCYWDKKHQGANKETLKELQEIVDIMTILSGLAIDNAKRKYDVDIKNEIDYISEKLEKYLMKHEVKKDDKVKEIFQKPNFWRYVSQDKQLKKEEGRKEKLIKYNTPMDILGEVIDDKIGIAKYKNNIDLGILLIEDLDKNNADRKQMDEIINMVKELDDFISHSFENKTEENEDDTYREIDLRIDEVEEKLKSKTIKAETMLGFMKLINGDGQKQKVKNVNEIALRLINVLYRKNPKTFLSIFK